MSHINEENIIQGLSDTEKAHLNTCSECLDKYEVLMMLSKEKECLELMTPPPHVWQRIEKTRSRKQPSRFAYFVGVAASLFIMVSGGMTWKTHQLHQDVNQLISKNQMLEQMLVNKSYLNYQEAEAFEELQVIDEKLIQNVSASELKFYLKQRHQLMMKIVDLQKGAENENYL